MLPTAAGQILLNPTQNYMSDSHPKTGSGHACVASLCSCSLYLVAFCQLPQAHDSADLCTAQEPATGGVLCLQELRAIPGVGTVIDALSAYTERHLARMDRLRRSVRLLDYSLGCMHVLEESLAQACFTMALPCVYLPARQLLKPGLETTCLHGGKHSC